MEQEQRERRRGAWCGRCPHCGSLEATWADWRKLSPREVACGACGRITRTVEAPAQAETDAVLEAGAWFGRAGGLAAWQERADAALDVALAENIRRIGELWEVRRKVGALVARTRCLVWGTVLRWLVITVENARARRGGRDEDVVRPHRERETAYAGPRHALAVAVCGTGTVLGGAGALRLGGASALHKLPRGMVLGQMAVAPSHSGTVRARGEDAILDSIDLDRAMGAAGLSDLDRELLALVDVGRARARAKKTAQGIEPAVEPMEAAEALALLRQRHQGRADLPASLHEARRRIRRARGAVADALAARGLVPPPERRPAPVRAPRQAVERINPLEALQ